jgi:hypothetical protein
MNRVKLYLELWTEWMKDDRSEIARKLGYSASKLIKSEASHDFDQLADSEEAKAANIVDTVIHDEEYIGVLERAAIYHFHLGARYPSDAGEIREVAYAWALDGLERGINAKGLA